ncbi:receptor-like protein kinase 2 [Cucumis melo var. makuwa]|uniref:Receptor-like protein kinase 2 n=2 Tax=Cucumis melo TaxID=3656 RepID=A0A1S3AW94_CUCME|nr:LRR receptor-like serine/threonine-protein kinase RGI1 [Cucumis melo]TYK17382.1 receptor-like protein kinase 2 [Cucumis melo var. makuwa]
MQMSSMPSSRQYFSISSSSFFFFSFSCVLHCVSYVSASNGEASLLFSWLRSSGSGSHFSDWNDLDASPCTWTSISCSSHGFVTDINIQFVPLRLPLPSNLSSFRFLQKLVISGANITGKIPDDIGNCTELVVLDLSFNNLVGSIPGSLGNLQKLEDLILNGNQLTGSIPAELGFCSSLKNLFIFDNLLSGFLPSDVGKLENLEVLRAGGNKEITGEIPPEIGNCSKLTLLGLADTRISGRLPSSLGKLKNLQTLSIYTTLLSGEIPSDLGNCSELVDLYLYENGLSGSIPPQIGELKKLEQLFLWQNNLIGAIPKEIGNCSSLRRIDFSLNYLSGTLPLTLGKLSKLEEFMISDNNVSGSIPSSLSNAKNLLQLQFDNNQISGLIPPELGTLSKLTVLLAWQNQLEGSIPDSLEGCSSLEAIDLSHNSLTGVIPSGLFQLRNLTKLLLISNDISGPIPPEIGNGSSLVRLRLGNNRITGGIPRTIGRLSSLDFLDLSGNRISGPLPDEIGNCKELQMIDLSYNALEGPLPNSLASLSELQVFDVSSNRFLGELPGSLGSLVSLNKLVLRENLFSGSIPPSLGLCSGLQRLDLSNNHFTGTIPVELGQLDGLEIALNLSNNELYGPIPPQMSALTKLSVLDLSRNKLEGDLKPLAGLSNLVSLNISYNNFSGYLPDNKLFRQLSPTDLTGNERLCSSIRDSCFSMDGSGLTRNGNNVRLSHKLKLAIALLVALTFVMIIMGIIAVVRARRNIIDDDDSELGDKWPWQFTPFQKLNFSVDQVLRSLIDSNVIGKGCSGVVYRADIGNGEIIAVKKLWPTISAAADGYIDDKPKVRDSFSTEVKTLGLIRHKNIVRFLGCCWNKNTRLLMYDYMPNGSLGSLLHERGGNNDALDWGLRYKILLGAAQGLAYLHHDCVPAIVHRDIKANNILVGLDFEPYIADFGLAKLVDEGNFGRSSNTVAGSYGYIAPEYGYMMKITEKSDVYSFGVVVLEVLTGKQPIDPTIPGGQHVVDWVRQKKGMGVLDSALLSRPESEIEEMMQVLGIALLCVNFSPDERPNMKDVAAMLKEIKQETDSKIDVFVEGGSDGQENKRPRGVLLAMATASSSSNKLGIESVCVKSDGFSLTSSSLLHPSSSTAKMGAK